MQVKVSDLKLNDRNPRRFTDANLWKLVDSILGFPKMLSVRGIICNKSKIVLCGNMRTSALMKIKDLLPEDIENRLMETGHHTDEILEFWVKWQKKPVANVTICDLSEEKELELIYKDNHEFGEFDVEKLRDVYSEGDLKYFGVPEDLLYIPEEDETVDYKEKGSAPKKIDKLTLGDYRIEISKDEYDLLMDDFNAYIEANTVSYGYGRHLVEQFRYRNGTDRDLQN